MQREEFDREFRSVFLATFFGKWHTMMKKKAVAYACGTSNLRL